MQFELIYILPQGYGSESVYNPDGAKAYVTNLGSKTAKTLNVQTPQVVSVENLGGGNFRVIRRSDWPISNAAYNVLLNPESGSGGSGNNDFIFKGSDNEFSAGVPKPFETGLEQGGDWWKWLIGGAAILLILNE